MNHYEFPLIEDIDVVREAIKGRDEFIIAGRDHYQVVNYLVNMPDTFPNPETAPDRETEFLWRVRRECRGFVFDKKGKPIARRFHKFFNIGEKLETQIHTIDITKPHVVMAKEDGSMITPFLLPSDTLYWHRYRGTTHQKRTTWGTKMGTTDVAAKMIERFVKQSNYSYEALALECIIKDLTPIFEWCSPAQKIVLDYQTDKLVLTAVRHLYTGQYLSMDELRALAEPFNVPVVDVFDPIDDLNAFVERVRGEELIEGYIVRFDDGHMLKQKTGWYCLIHGTFDTLQHEKNVLQICIGDEFDDFYASCTEHNQERLDTYRNDLYKEISVTSERINSMYKDVLGKLPKVDISDPEQAKQYRAAFAREVNTNVSDKRIASMLFNIMNKQSTATNEVIGFMMKVMTKGPAIDENRDMINDLNWLNY